jgi:hypothetical protein
MMTAAEKLTSMFYEETRYLHPLEELLPLQIAAMNELLTERRAQIRVLDGRARDAGVDAIEDLSNAVPLLFAHTVYKSYPEAFLADGRWDRMCMWLETLSSSEPRGLDMSGVTDVDQWVERLHEAGHFVYSSSGTTGKCSFLDQNEFERDLLADEVVRSIHWASGVEANSDRPVFILGPRRGAARMVQLFDGFANAFGRPGEMYWLSDEPMSIGEMTRLGELARRLSDGSATPHEVAQGERRAGQRQERMRQELQVLVDAIVRHRADGSVIFGAGAQLWTIMQMIQERGLGDLEFSPDTLLVTGGGMKGAELPQDYLERIRQFFGVEPRRVVRFYSMSEITAGVFPLCSAGRYHCPPWVVLFILDRSGERLLNCATGTVNGRLGAFDLMTQTRWGGIITGDNVDADFSACPCGAPGPTIQNIVRYADLDDGDDKLTCAGSLDAYVRGLIS